MQFAVQASVQGMRLLPGPVSTLRHHVASGASAQLGAVRAGAPGVRSALASPFLAPGLGPLQVPAKPSLRSGGRVELESARAEAQVGVGAYNRDSFVSETEANKIAQHETGPPLKKTPKAKTPGRASDRFITDRSAMDYSVANFMLKK